MTAQDIAFAAPQPFGIGRILATSFGAFGRNLGPFLIVTFLISVPFIALATWNDYQNMERELGAARSGYQFGLSFVQMITSALVQAALTYGTLEDLRGHRPTVGACFENGWRWGTRLFRGAFIYSIIILLATLALVVPAIILYLMWWVYVPAIVVEGLGVSDSFSRSRALTAGRRWRILGLGLVTLLILAVVAAVVMLPIEFLAGDFPAQIGFTLVAVLFGAFSSVVTAVGYYTLLVEKEGVDIEAIAQVFG